MDTFEEIEKIHRNIKSRFIYQSDIEVWGTLEHWERYDQIPDDGDIIGDCDCFALACRKECRKLDIPSRLVHVITETNEGHLVLAVDEWILDNRMGKVVTKQYLDSMYLWIGISSYQKGGPWRKIL